MNRKLKRFIPVFFWMLVCIGISICNPIEASAADFYLSATDVDQTQRMFRIAMNQSEFTNVYQTLFAVWGDQNGQNDMQWYRADEMSDGTYLCDVPVSNHGETGSYTVHAYVETTDGYLYLMGYTGFQVTAVSQPYYETYAGDLTVAELNGGASYQIDLYNAKIQGLSGVQFAVWADQGGQDDLWWYQGTRYTDGSFSCTVPISSHGQTGNYNVHAYAVLSDGSMQFLTGGTFYVENNMTASIQTARISDSQYQVQVVAPWVDGYSSRVLFPTWSEVNGQDDLVWYEGVRSSDGIWYVNVDGTSHGSTGTYITHAYIQMNGQNSFVGGVSYTLNFATQPRAARDASAVIGSITNGSMDSGTKLLTCYNWVVNNISYQTLPIPLQPEAGYSQEDWYAIYGLEQRSGNCYCYAAAFAAMARQLGYSATMVYGSVPLYSGGWGPHAWVEIYMNGATYICDPESQYENPGYGFYMTTYATAPYAYQK